MEQHLSASLLQMRSLFQVMDMPWPSPLADGLVPTVVKRVLRSIKDFVQDRRQGKRQQRCKEGIPLRTNSGPVTTWGLQGVVMQEKPLLLFLHAIPATCAVNNTAPRGTPFLSATSIGCMVLPCDPQFADSYSSLREAVGRK